MLSVNVNFHDASVELPEKDGDYIVVANNVWLSRTVFSTKWQMFNVSNHDSTTETAIDVYYWAEIPEELKLAVRGKELIFEDEDFEI